MKNLTVRKKETLEIAENLKDDIEHLEKFLSGSTPNRTELRMISTVLRRMFLQQKELKNVAGPRVPNFSIQAPDFSSFAAIDTDRLVFFAACGGTAFGVSVQAALLNEGSSPLGANDFHPENSSELGIDKFLKQKTIFWRGHWFDRSETIAFACNKMGGAHTGKLSSKREKVLKDLCAHGHIALEEGVPTISIKAPSCHLIEGRPKLSSKAIDFVLFDAFSSMNFLIKSPSTKELLGIISNETE
ncbi:MAG: hypothetical protein ACR2O2_08740 [Ruegeria sp.]